MLMLARVVAALLSGALLAQAYGLNPFWPLAWIAPIPLLIAATGASRLGAFFYGALAGVCSLALMFSYLLGFGGPIPVLIIALFKALMWGGLASATRSAARHLPAWAAIFVFPALLAGIDTLTAATSPHGTAGALAYSQMDFLPAIQIASLGGAPAVTFIVALFASVIALTLTKRALIAAIAPVSLIAGSLVFGYLRIAAPPAETQEAPRATLLVGDQHLGIPMDWRIVWNAYTPQIERAADEGRRIVLLPEKIAHISPGERGAAIEQLAEIARRRHILIIAGVDDEADDGRFNRAFIFTPDGWDRYDKRHMIPGFESHFDPGAGPYTFEFEGVRYGVAICKDMDFPALGRGYAGVTAMLVPAWDFEVDAWYHSRVAMLRGVENGYAIVRSARQGALTVNDAFGRVIYQAPSGPQTAYNVSIPLNAPGPTLYARIGDVFGWAMLALAALLIGWSTWARTRAGQGG